MSEIIVHFSKKKQKYIYIIDSIASGCGVYDSLIFSFISTF